MKAPMKAWLTRGVLGSALVLGVLAGAAPASAATGRDFGQHVAACAQEMGGFNGTDNPGMHRGFAGWDGTACQP